MRRKPGRRPAKKAEKRELLIDRLGRSGEGMAGDIAIPYVLPGERVMAAVSGKQARPTEIVQPAEDRKEPVCPHFGLPGDGCGGCHLQHMGLEGSLSWKRRRLEEALQAAGLSVSAIKTQQSAPLTRRRARLGLIRTGKGWRAGFRGWRSHDIVPMRECHILAPALWAAIEAFLPKGDRFLPGEVKSAELILTLTDSGVDFDISGVDDALLDLPQRVALADFAQEHDLARLSVGNVPLAQARTPVMELGGISVPVPTGTFLQATVAGQAALTALVEEGVGKAARVADLFCGLGTFALPLSRTAEVAAYDSDGPAIAALTTAARGARRPVETGVRDLFDLPLSPDELARFDAVVLDPPRAGAESQAAALAASSVPVVVSVSCHPDSFARDAQILAATYDLMSVALVDQFIWSPHIEMVGVFHRRP